MTQDTLPITGLPRGDVSPAVLVCGDPDRATRTAVVLQNSALLSEQREYRAFRGEFQGMPVVVCSHGVGAPGAAVAFEELIIAGARRLIRIGTCGGLPPAVTTGDLVIATAAVQNTGYGREIVPDGYPAVADLQLTLALREAAVTHGTGAQGRSVHSGLVLSRDAFFPGVTTPGTPDYQIMSVANVLAVEMECAALFLVGSLRGVQTAAILAVDGNVLETRESVETYRPHQERVAAAVDAEIEIALQALHRLNQP